MLSHRISPATCLFHISASHKVIFDWRHQSLPKPTKKCCQLAPASEADSDVKQPTNHVVQRNDNQPVLLFYTKCTQTQSETTMLTPVASR